PASTTAISTLALHDALPIWEDDAPAGAGRAAPARRRLRGPRRPGARRHQRGGTRPRRATPGGRRLPELRPLPPSVGAGERRLRADRKSTRLNSSHVSISYAV